jgi:RimJ/RimL family protein N-acetyltransferase
VSPLEGSLQLRRPEPADERFLERLREPAYAGEFNSFDDEAPWQGPTLPVGRFVVTLADATPIGGVGWIAVPYGPNKLSRAWNIGITLLPEYRGMGYGWQAQAMLAAHLFAQTEANRVEASTDVANIAEQRALERAGFQREGVLRGAQHRNGAWRDLVLYARLRGDA